MKSLEHTAQIPPQELIVIGSPNEDFRDMAKSRGFGLRVYSSESDYRAQRSPEKPTLGDFTRKSIVGAGYRVGSSFLMDALYLTAAGAAGYYLADKFDLADSISHSASEFVQNLDPWKLGRVAAAVVGINFADYKWNITENLDRGVKHIAKKVRKLIDK